MEMEDEDLEMLRQAALRSMGTNKNRRRDNPTQSRVNQPSRIKTNGNLIEIQPSDDFASVVASGEEGLNSDDYVVEEFVLDGSDISINSSDCDEVIEEVIVSDAEEIDDNALVDTDHQTNKDPEKSSPSRSLSSHRQNSSDDDESDAVSIKSSYSLIMEVEEDFQSVEAKFLSRKLQKPKAPADTTNSTANDDVSSRRRRSRSPISLPSLTSRTVNRRSRSRERDANRSTNRKSRSRSRTPPIRRRNQSPSIRGTRRPYRTNSNERNQRRRRTRSRSPNNRLSPPSNRNRYTNQNSRRQKSRSKSPAVDKSKPRLVSNSQSGAPKSPVEDKLPEKIQKTVKNNHIPPEQLDRLEKRRKKFEEESEVAPRKQVIKIASSGPLHPFDKEKQSTVTSKSSKVPKTVSSTSKPVVLKEKVQKASKRSVELVNESDLTPIKSNDKANTRQNKCDSKDKCSSGDNQEDLRARLIKKKMEKQMQQGSGSTSSNSGSSNNGPLSSVVVPVNNKGSHRIFSQALKNSQLLDSVLESSNSSTNKSKESSRKTERSATLSSTSTSTETPLKIHKPKSEVTTSHRNSGSSRCKKLKLNSSRGGTTSSLSSKSKSSTSSSGTKRVVSVTYS